MQKIWRLLPFETNNPYLNMAVDEAVLISQSQEEIHPTLRFYTWNPPSISLGYFQKVTTEDKDRWQKLNIPFVRRLSGGRAVFHNNDLTYSFILREDLNLLPKNINQSCRIIGKCLFQGLKNVGIDQKLLEINSTLTKNIGDQNCFNIFSQGEIIFNGKKIIGSAQVRKKGVILQHGSILTGALTTMTLKEIIPAIVSGFESVFKAKFEIGCLTEEEKRLTLELEKKYREQNV